MMQPAVTSGQHLEHLRAITVKDACSRLNVTRMTLHRWEKLGIVRLVRIGGCVRVPITELERLLTPTPPPQHHANYQEQWQADHQHDD